MCELTVAYTSFEKNTSKVHDLIMLKKFAKVPVKMYSKLVHYHDNVYTAKHAKFEIAPFCKICYVCSFLLNTLKYHKLFQFHMNLLYYFLGTK